MSTTAYKIEVMQWHEDGNPIEISPRGEHIWCHMHLEPRWNWDDTDYRKKPKPIECWVTILDGDTASTVHMSKKDAERVYCKGKDRWSVRKVVIE